MSKVYVFLAAFEEVEALIVVDLLRRAEIDITIIMDTKSCWCSWDNYSGTNYMMMWIYQLNVSASRRYAWNKVPWEHEGLVTMLKSFNDKNKLIAAICAAPSVLGVNNTKGKKATASWLWR